MDRNFLFDMVVTLHFFSEKSVLRFKILAMKDVLRFLIFTWNWKVEIILATVFLKRYILVISYHRLQHRGQEGEFFSLR